MNKNEIYKQCKILDCPFAKTKEEPKRKNGSRIEKLSDAMELVKQAFSLNSYQMINVMGNLYDYIGKTYPDKAKLMQEI